MFLLYVLRTTSLPCVIYTQQRKPCKFSQQKKINTEENIKQIIIFFSWLAHKYGKRHTHTRVQPTIESARRDVKKLFHNFPCMRLHRENISVYMYALCLYMRYGVTTTKKKRRKTFAKDNGETTILIDTNRLCFPLNCFIKLRKMFYTVQH